MGSHNFHSLAEVRNTLELFKATTEQEKETLVAMGVLTVLVDAILKVVAEVEELKSHQEQPRRK